MNIQVEHDDGSAQKQEKLTFKVRSLLPEIEKVGKSTHLKFISDNAPKQQARVPIRWPNRNIAMQM
jgi:hypothetical protein